MVRLEGRHPIPFCGAAMGDMTERVTGIGYNLARGQYSARHHDLDRAMMIIQEPFREHHDFDDTCGPCFSITDLVLLVL
jgi:hypothetical protein